jgi:hypothetical protein
MEHKEEINSFKESQRFNQPWLWVIVIAAALLPLIIEFLSGQLDFRVAGGVSAAMLIFVILLLRMFRLLTVVDDQGVYYRLIPLHTRPVFVPWADLDKVYVRKYKPLREFGGWGMRISFRNGTAFNISGNMGLQLLFKGGKKKILIGTRQPEQLSQLLEQLGQQGVISREMITPIGE